MRRFHCSHITSQNAVGDLLDLSNRFRQRPVLITATDQAATFVAKNAERLREHFKIPIQSASVVQSLSSKKELYHLANAYNIPTPKVLHPHSEQEVLAFLEQVSFPILLKPIHGTGGKGQICLNRKEEVMNVFDRTNRCENVVLQEYIPGGPDASWLFTGYFNDKSDCLFGQSGKSLRRWPSTHGLTTLGICLPNRKVEETSKSFMKAIGYAGIVDLDWRYDNRDGKYKVLDVNPRIGSDFRIFVSDNGMDVVRAYYYDMTGRRVTPGKACEGRKWIAENLDIRASVKSLRDGNLTIGQLIESLRGLSETGVFAKDDLLPFLYKTTCMDSFEYHRDLQAIKGRS